MIDNQLQSDADGEHPATEQNALTVATQDVPLTNYDAARRALAEAVRIDEVRAIHDQAMAMKACAKIAKDRQMELDAAEIRMRAERRLGQIMAAQAKTVGKAKGGGDKKSDHRVFRKPSDPPTLAEAGIDKNVAHRSRKAASLSPKEFDKEVAEMRKGNRGTLNIRRAAKPVKRTVDRVDDAEPHVEVAQVQIPAKSPHWSFLARAQLAEAGARYDGLPDPELAAELAIAARNVAASWTAIAVQFEQAARDAEEPAIASRENDEHDRG